MNLAFLDIDTQLDFMFPAGALYVPGAERLLPVFKRLNRFAAAAGIPIISTTDAHSEDDPEFSDWPPHCVAGTAGQQKAAGTLVEGARQIVVRKQAIDFFDDPNFQNALAQLGAGRYVVYGLVTEYCVRSIALGLLRRGKPVDLVTDAIRAIDPGQARRSLEEITASGGRLVTVAEICPQ